ncbi:MAG: DUF4132 domain-containing protein [Candidatus Riflebacteria bacterium]|nr:DUF4132 domain-containing protein [Candidatus Riflebacteria bacterium]
MRRFELVEGKSSKFWEVSRDGSSLSVRFGRIGSNGQTRTRSFASESDAEAELGRLVREKCKKGYTEKRGEAKPDEAKGDGGRAADPAADTAPPVARSGPAPRKPPPPDEKAAPEGSREPGWLDAGGGYWLKLAEGKLVCRKGSQTLASVPKPVKECGVAEHLLMLREWLEGHRQACVETVESWMLRSLPVPRVVLEAVWPDPAWRATLENCFVVAFDGGAAASGSAGFLRGVSDRGIGLVDLDGETIWVRAHSVAIPHPVLVDELDEIRGLATDLSLTQGISQLFRETFAPGRDLDPAATAVQSYADGRFVQLNHCLAHCRKLGYRVKGGSAIVRVWERGEVFEARFWIGSEDPTAEACTGDLVWVGVGDKPVPVSEIPPVAFSEGMRMASAIHAARVVEKEADHA